MPAPHQLTDKGFDAARYQYKLHEAFGGRVFNGDGEMMTWLRAATEQAQPQHSSPSRGNLVPPVTHVVGVGLLCSSM